MEILVRAAQLILSLSILVTLHELGHYAAAKLFKTRVEKFYLFFDPWFSLFKKKIGETEWGIGWLPLGGYVKIAGMVDESMDTEQLKSEPQPWEFRAKPAWQRLIIMIGGVTVNIIVGVVIYIGIVFSYGTQQLNPNDLKDGLAIHPAMQKYGLETGDNITQIDGKDIQSIQEINNIIMLRGGYHLSVTKKDGTQQQIQLPDGVEMELFKEGAFPTVAPRAIMDTLMMVDSSGLGFKAGLQVGDQIISINGETLTYFDQLQKATFDNKNKEIQVVISRNGEQLEKTIQLDETGLLGIGPKTTLLDKDAFKEIHYSFGQSITKGCELGYYTLSDYVSQFKFIFTKKGASSLGGFGTIAKLFPTTWDWQIFWMNTAFISIILAFMNILPIPALDGGHVVFLTYEMITGREAPEKVLIIAQYIGIAILLSLLIYANGNDIYQMLFK